MSESKGNLLHGPFGLMRAASTLMSRLGLGNRAGITFAGERDVYGVLGYKKDIRIQDFRDRYRRNGIAARVVDAYPQATWRGGVELIEDEDPTMDTPFEEAFQELDDRLRVFAALYRTDVLAGLGHYAVLLIGVPGELNTPMPNRVSPEQLLFLSPYAEDEAQITKVVTATDDPRFGLPEMYRITRNVNSVAAGSFAGSAAVRSSTWSADVHWSRVLHVATGVLDDRVFGLPRLERIWNDLDNLDKVAGAGSEAFWLRAHQGFHFGLDKEVEMTQEDIDKAKEELADFTNGIKRMVLTRGMTMDPKGSDVANFDKPVDTILTMISGATGIPKRILMGSERGELASTQDKENWDQRVTDRRNDFAEPYMVRPLVDLFIERGILPEPDEYNVRWAEMEDMNETEQAAIAEKWAGLNAAAGGVVVLPEEIRDRVLRLEPLTPEQLAEIEAEEELQEQEAFDEDGNPIPAPGEEPEAEPGAPEEEQEPTAAAAARPKVTSPARFTRLFLAATDAAQAAVPQADLLRGVATFDNNAIQTAYLAGVVAFRDTLTAELERALVAAAVRAARQEDAKWAKGELEIVGLSGAATQILRAAAKRLGFAVSDPGVTAWAAKHAAQTINGVSEGTRLAIAILVNQAQARGWTPEYLTRRLMGAIGLDRGSVRAILNLRENILRSAGGVVRIGRDLRLRVPKDIPLAWLERQLERYEKRLLRARARVVGSDLMVRAVTEGRRRYWEKLRDAGKLPKNVERIWRTSGKSNVCPICEELEGDTARLGEPYDAEGGEIMGPPAHPSCNCHEQLFVER